MSKTFPSKKAVPRGNYTAGELALMGEWLAVSERLMRMCRAVHAMDPEDGERQRMAAHLRRIKEFVSQRFTLMETYLATQEDHDPESGTDGERIPRGVRGGDAPPAAHGCHEVDEDEDLP